MATMGTTSTRYTDEFKQVAVVLYREAGEGATYAEVAKGLGVDPGTLSSRAGQADGLRKRADGSPGDTNPFRLAEELRKAKKGERAAQEGERDALESQRPLRGQAAVRKARFGFIPPFRHGHGVAPMCRALEVARAGRCARRDGGPGGREPRDAQLGGLTGEACVGSRLPCGSPKVHRALARRGVRTSRKRVARIMRERGMRGVTRSASRRGRDVEKRASRANSAPDLARRDLGADGPNELWFADITYVRTYQGWPCLAVVMDVWSRMAVGWSMGPHITAELADDAPRMAIARRRPGEGRTRHGGHGSRYVSLPIGKTMRDNGIRPSMGSVSSPWDNAVTESLMGIIKTECVHARTFDSREQASPGIFEYIECFYNRVRIHSALGWVSPREFESRASGDRLRAE